MTDAVLQRLAHTRTEHVTAAVRMLGRLQNAQAAKTELAVDYAHYCIEQGQSSATAVKSAETYLRALSAPNVLPMRRHTKPHTG